MKDLLRNKVLEVTFTKANGDERIMLCTLKSEHLPIGGSGKTGVERPGVITVWDLEAKAWRCFKENSVISFKEL